MIYENKEYPDTFSYEYKGNRYTIKYINDKCIFINRKYHGGKYILVKDDQRVALRKKIGNPEKQDECIAGKDGGTGVYGRAYLEATYKGISADIYKELFAYAWENVEPAGERAYRKPSGTTYQKRAQKKYAATTRRANNKTYNIAINENKYPDVIEHLSNCKNVAGYIKGLIRKDMAENGRTN